MFRVNAFCLTAVQIGVLLVLPVYVSCESESPIVIDSGIAQLFVDDFLINSQSNLKRTLHQPVKENRGDTPIIELAADTFGGYSFTLEANGSILHDLKNQDYVLFAVAFSSEMGKDQARSWEKARLYRFTSPDGLTWSRGEWVFPRSKEDFLDSASGKYATNMDLFSCCYDTKDPEYPYKGWMWYANWGTDLEGIHFVKSKDGLNWERGKKIIDGWTGTDDKSSRVIQQDSRTLCGAGDVTTFYQDAVAGRFLGLIKFVSKETVGPNNRLRSRAYAFLDRLDEPFDLSAIVHVDLVPKAATESGDLPNDEYYASTGWRYESLWLGGLKVWHDQGDYPYSPAGAAFLKLVHSRDGLHWEKVPYENESGVREVWLPNGREGGNDGRNDGGYMTEFSTGPLRIQDELVYYYGSSSFGKNNPTGIRVTGGGIFRSHLRLDGFVSVDSGNLTTRALSFSGKQLTVNSAGPVQVTIMDQLGKVLGMVKLKGDSLRHDISIEGKPISQVVANQIVCLRFEVSEGGHLYSFTLR
jgi:hypothetical protein